MAIDPVIMNQEMVAGMIVGSRETADHNQKIIEIQTNQKNQTSL